MTKGRGKNEGLAKKIMLHVLKSATTTDMRFQETWKIPKMAKISKIAKIAKISTIAKKSKIAKIRYLGFHIRFNFSIVGWNSLQITDMEVYLVK